MKKGYTKEDRLMSEIMKDFPMDTPSADFTDRVMQAVGEAERKSVAETSPLISKAGWIGIAASLSALILYVFLGSGSARSTESTSFFDKLPSFSIPQGFGLNSIFDRFSFDSPVLIWIFTAIGGLLLMAFIDRMINGIRERYFFS